MGSSSRTMASPFYPSCEGSSFGTEKNPAADRSKFDRFPPALGWLVPVCQHNLKASTDGHIKHLAGNFLFESGPR